MPPSQVGVLTRSLRVGSSNIEVLGDLKVILRLLANMTMGDSSTGKVRMSVWEFSLCLSVYLRLFLTNLTDFTPWTGIAEVRSPGHEL